MEIINKTYPDSEICRTYLHHAYRIAGSSPDPSTQVGAVIVHPTMGALSHGCNTLPEGLRECNKVLQTDDKYHYIEHAERNAILSCFQAKYSPKDSTMYATWACCPDCARAIIASGINKVVSHKEMYDRYTGESKKLVDIGIEMLEKANIEVILWSGDVSKGRIKIKTSGKIWSP
jgi:dCMP deaminase